MAKFTTYANKLLQTIASVLKNKGNIEKFNRDIWYRKRKYYPIELIKYLGFDINNFTLEDAKRLIAKIAGYDSFNALEKTKDKERELAELIIKNCTSKEVYVSWISNISKEVNPEYEHMSIKDKLTFARNFFPSDYKKTKAEKRIKPKRYHNYDSDDDNDYGFGNMPFGEEFDSDYSLMQD